MDTLRNHPNIGQSQNREKPKPKYIDNKDEIERKLYTRGGDKGETSLYGASRVPKDSLRVEAYGTVDELNSCIGVAIAVCKRKGNRQGGKSCECFASRQSA